MKETGKVIILPHDSKSKAAIDRENAFKEEMQQNHPGITIGDVYHLDQAGRSAGKVGRRDQRRNLQGRRRGYRREAWKSRMKSRRTALRKTMWLITLLAKNQMRRAACYQQRCDESGA